MSTTGIIDVAVGGKLDQDHKRERDQKHKWAFGEETPSRGRVNKRPVKLVSAVYVAQYRPSALANTLACSTSRAIKNSDFPAHKIAKISRKANAHFDNDTLTSDSSAEEDVKEASVAPEPDAGITYSFDAARGPAKGSQILSMALAKAVEKYEVRATEKLVKEEYEVVAKEKEEIHDGYSADEDDFELI